MGYLTEISLVEEKGEGNIVNISGLINWMLVGTNDDGTLKVSEYMDNVRVTAGRRETADRVRAALESVNNEIVKQREVLRNGNPELSYCIDGRDMTQVKGKGAGKTEARFPHLMDAYISVLSNAAKNQAMMNYLNKYQELKQEILKKSDMLNAQYACYSMPIEGERRLHSMGLVAALSNNAELKPRGGQITKNDLYALSETITDSVSVEDIAKLAGGEIKNEVRSEEDSVSYSLMTTFSPETRECRICTDAVMCSTKIERLKSRATDVLMNIAISCGMGMISAGIASAAKAGASAGTGGVQVGTAVAQHSDKLIMGTEAIAQETITNTGVTIAKQAAISAAEAGAIGGAAGSVAVMGGVSAAESEREKAQRKEEMAEEIAWAVANVAIGVGVGYACGQLALLTPWGTVAAAAITALAAVGAGLSHAFRTGKQVDQNCEPIERQCQIYKM